MAELLDWSILSNNTTVTTVIPDNQTSSYDLYNLTNKEAIRYGERIWGINLVWDDPAKADNIRFQHEPNTNDPLRFEEPIAIFVKGGKFLRYQTRSRGVNLGWSDAPVFEWRIIGGEAGREVPAGQMIGLYNTVENDSLMYEPRDWGINLKWFKDSGKYDELSSLIRAGEAIKEWWGSL